MPAFWASREAGLEEIRGKELRILKKIESRLRAHVIRLQNPLDLGDIFDFWWEYKKVVPKGFTRFLGMLSHLTDSGIDVHLFTGNHDLWMKSYLEEECGITIHHEPLLVTIGGELFYLAHGEGLGTRSKGFRILLSLFHNRILQRAYSAIHPRIGLGIGHAWSNSSRLAKHVSLPFLGEENEDLIRHTREIVRAGCEARYFIYGHRHLPMEIKLGKSTYINTGDWITQFTYVVFDGRKLEIKKFMNED